MFWKDKPYKEGEYNPGKVRMTQNILWGEDLIREAVEFKKEKGDMVKAKEYLNSAVELDPLNPAAHRELGRVERDQGNMMEAEEHFKEAYRLEPEDMEVRDELEAVMLERRTEKKPEDRFSVKEKVGIANNFELS